MNGHSASPWWRGPAAAGGSRTVNTAFTVDCPAGTGGLLPRTGAMVLRWSLAGGALVAIGALVLMANRRRATPITEQR